MGEQIWEMSRVRVATRQVLMSSSMCASKYIIPIVDAGTTMIIRAEQTKTCSPHLEQYVMVEFERRPFPFSSPDISQSGWDSREEYLEKKGQTERPERSNINSTSGWETALVKRAVLD